MPGEGKTLREEWIDSGSESGMTKMYKVQGDKIIKNLFTYSPTNLLTSKKAAFTLAEVLITLAIIGVVAAMTIPTLITSYTEKATVTALKKVLSTFSQGYLHAVFENGTPDTWGLTAGTAEGAAKFIKIMQPYFKITKICEEDSSCLNDIYYTLQGTKKRIYTDRASAILNDGSTIWIYVFDSNSPQITDQTKPSLKNDIVAELTADINGFAGPNIFGKDVFSFWVTKNNIIPKGRKGDSYTIESYCNLAAPEEEAHYNSGESCSSWVIDIGNMDYLHCDDLSWTGKHKCSD